MLNKEVGPARVKENRLTQSNTTLKCYISHQIMLRKPWVSPPPAEWLCIAEDLDGLEETCTLAIYSLRT